ncbi:MAG: Crp/Fnr family transcriptional regulator [Fibrobacter sp.]|nr:Crp/Fnr family transcriptional regulator [Fibrobacter sp.]
MIIKQDQTLCREGKLTNSLFIVKEGLLKGTSSEFDDISNYGPGTIIGELNLLDNTTCQETVIAEEDSEIQEITRENLESTLANEPNWLRSILTFLTSRFHIAKKGHIQNVRVMALPSLLFVLKSCTENSPSNAIRLSKVIGEMQNLVNLKKEATIELLESLKKLDVIKMINDEIRIENPRVISLLYNTILFRAIQKKVSPNILSATEQMILTAFTSAVQENNEPLKNGTCVIATSKLKSIIRKKMHGMSLTMRMMMPLIVSGLITPSTPLDVSSIGDIDTVEFFFGDFEKILDMLELNRIFPLLDKGLVS